MDNYLNNQITHSMTTRIACYALSTHISQYFTHTVQIPAWIQKEVLSTVAGHLSLSWIPNYIQQPFGFNSQNTANLTEKYNRIIFGYQPRQLKRYKEFIFPELERKNKRNLLPKQSTISERVSVGTVTPKSFLRRFISGNHYHILPETKSVAVH